MAKDLTSGFNDSKMLEILKDINQLKEEVSQTSDEEKKTALNKTLADMQMYYNILSEQRGAV